MGERVLHMLDSEGSSVGSDPWNPRAPHSRQKSVRAQPPMEESTLLEAKTVFVIIVATYRMIFPGLSPVTPTPGAEPQRPPATRSLTMDLWSAAGVDSKCRAEVALPEGLKMGESARLTIDHRWRPNGGEAELDTSGVVKTYWGCAEAAPQGQPKVTGGALPAKPDAPDVARADTLPKGSYAYWPTQDAPPLPAEAATSGTYTLTTNYAGGASVTLGEEQAFLDTIDLIGVSRKPDLSKPLKVSWSPVAGAVAYIVDACGGAGAESVNWTSSADPREAEGIDARPLVAEEVAKLIERKVLLPADATSCVAPAGIFAGSKSVFLTVTAIGADKVEAKDGVETRVLVRSQVSVPLAGTTYKPEPEKKEAK